MEARSSPAMSLAMRLRNHMRLGYKLLTSKNIRPARMDKVSKVRRAKDLRVTIRWTAKRVQSLRERSFLLHRGSAYLNQDTAVRR
jgi:hypothetical protein